jgi:hypothetical protein
MHPDGQQYVKDLGVSLEEAIRRLQVQNEIGRLRATLRANEPDTFAGLWLQHQPEFRIMVHFTQNGKSTVRPYIEDKAWVDLVEVRPARVTLSSLEAVLAETGRILDKLDFKVSFSLNEPENRVEVYVTDQPWFEGELQKANLQLPDYVELVTVAGQQVQDVDICATPAVPDVAFPRQAPVEGIREVMEAELIGELVLDNGCLRVNSIYGDGSILPVWPPEFTLGAENDVLQVLDGTGQVVARVGEEVYMGGGEGLSRAMAQCMRQQLPAACTGPYWIVGDGTRPNLQRDSDLFSIEVITKPERSLLLLHKKAILEEWADSDSSISGKLVLYEPHRCPRVQSDSGLIDYLPLWPHDYDARIQNGEIEIVNGLGQVAARVGETVHLNGGKIPLDWNSEQYRQLYNKLPGDCTGPYWIVGD